MTKSNGHNKDSGKKTRETVDSPTHEPQNTTPSLSLSGSDHSKILPDKFEEQPFFVVGLGASAGGLETLEQFFSNMPPDSGMAFVVVVHLDPTHKTLLPELLARYTRMEVRTAEEGLTVEPNVVYVIPANRDMTLSGGQLHLEEPQAPRGMRHTIDVFLRSLASDMEENAIAVILSGTGTDGTQGVKAVKESGGIIVVQEEATAKYPGMPQSAIATGVADLILPAPQIPEKILEIAQRSTLLAQRKEKEPAKQITEQLRAIFRIVNSRTSHDFSAYKVSTIVRRIERRMAVNDIININDYIKFLKDKPDESRALFKEFLIGVTSFFRDPEAFEALEKLVIPKLFEDCDPNEPLRIWLAGCATGEEAYSVAMLIREYSREHRLDVKVQIFATDIDGEAIDFARAGLYPDSIGTDVTMERLRTFFKKTDSTYTVVKPLREMIVFAQHNIIKDPPFSRLDLLICRNLLIYLNPELQKRIIPLFAQALKPKGFLFLGSSETVGGFTDLFLPLEKKWKIFQRRESGRRFGVEFPIAPLRSSFPETEPVRAYQEAGLSPGILAEKTLIQRYSPPCVVINEKFEVVYFSTRTSRYLEPPVGEPSQNLLKMAKDDLRPALRALVHKALSDQQIAVYRDLKITTDTGEETLDLRVEPITTPPSAKGLALVIFEPTRIVQLLEPQHVEQFEPVVEDESTQNLVVKQLEEQLRITNEQLQSSIERMETANEELKSSNEELMSMNEEFQSTNEELETSKEELQALNEELVTVNAELQNKVDELGQTNSDLQNFLTSTDIATIFLDRQFRVKRFSPSMAKLFNLISADIGRPLQHFSGVVNYPDLQEDAEKVLEKLTPIEREISDPERQLYYLVRMLPYRTLEDVIDGVVINFIDITDRQRAELARCESEDRFRAFMDNSPAIAWMKDEAGRHVYLNKTYENRFGVKMADWLGKTDFDIWPLEIAEQFRKNDLAVLSEGKNQKVMEETVAPDGEHSFWWNFKFLINDALGRRYVAGMGIDVTDRQWAEAELRKIAAQEQARAAELEALMEAVPAAVLISHDSECRVITGNKAAYELLRMTPGANTSKSNPDAPVAHFRVFHDGEELSPNQLPIQRVAAEGKPLYDFGEEILFDNGEQVSIYGNAVPLLDNRGKSAGAVAAFIDISPRAQAEQEIVRARQLAEDANRAKSDFVANMSHEIRTPLTGVLGMMELLKRTGLTEKQEEYLEMAEDSGRILLRVINDILDFSRIEAGKVEIAEQEFNLRNCINGIVNIFKLDAKKKNLDLSCSLPEALPEYVIGDFDRLRQVLFNLIGNALKFTESGSIDVSVHPEKKTTKERQPIRIEVSDTGIGIPDDKLEHIFESFTQLDSGHNRNYGGSGLGLAICRRLVELMGGTLAARSEVGKGSTFILTIPFTLAETDDDSSLSLPGNDGAASNLSQTASAVGRFRILLADDDTTIRHLVKTILSHKGYEILTVKNGEEAVNAWQKDNPELILMDVQMPLLDGLEATSRIRQLEENLGKRTPIVCLTAHAFEEDRNHCLESGADAYLSKPLIIEELYKLVERFKTSS